MFWIEIISKNPAIIGTTLIAIATILAVIISTRYNKKAEARTRRQKEASFAAALASELIDNVLTLIELYLEIGSPQAKEHKIQSRKHLDHCVYEKLLENIGVFGSALSYLVVDAYSDLKKLHLRLTELSFKEILRDKDDILSDIQGTIVKATAASFIILMYSDYLNGRQFLKEVADKRIFWLYRLLDEFFTYVAKIDKDMAFIGAEEELDIPFLKRFPDQADRDYIRRLVQSTKTAQKKMASHPTWKAQIILRALSYRFQNTLNYFLNIESNQYDLASEEQYKSYIED